MSTTMRSASGRSSVAASAATMTAGASSQAGIPIVTRGTRAFSLGGRERAQQLRLCEPAEEGRAADVVRPRRQRDDGALLQLDLRARRGADEQERGKGGELRLVTDERDR